MLIAIVAALMIMLGGASGIAVVAQIQERVPVVITDEAKAEVILEKADVMASLAQDATGDVVEALEAWSKADRDHSVGRGALKQALQKSANVRKEARAAFLDELFEIKSKMTKEQWKAVFEETEGDAE